MKKVGLPERYDENYELLKRDSMLNDLLEEEIESLLDREYYSGI